MNIYLIRKFIKSIALLLILLSLFFSSCRKEDNFPSIDSDTRTYSTKNIIIIVADGLRYSESWGDSTFTYIPRLAGVLAQQGVVNTNFYNQGDTYTSAGHSNITTGFYQTINNIGEEYPSAPSVFQYWNLHTNSEKTKSWVIASKDKLAILGDCNDPFWQGKFTPSTNTGIDGLGIGSGFRDDSLTLISTYEILKENHPHLVLVNFMDPDITGHSGDWHNYLKAIRKTDENIYRLWQFLQNDNFYKNTTTLFITSDHGRHLDSIADGFASHGDGCEGCRHVSFLAIGPDFKKGVVQNVSREQIDIPITIAELMGFRLPNLNGNVMTELFSNPRSN